MNKPHTLREAWHPQTAHDRETVLRELQEVVASSHFCNSKRYPALLQYIVENTLAGKSDLLKERSLGVDVFDRPPTYDTNTDTVVRYTAGEVRKRLLLYYSEHPKHSGVRLSLPAGSYIPEFLLDHDGSAEISKAATAVDTQVHEAEIVPGPLAYSLEPPSSRPGNDSSRFPAVLDSSLGRVNSSPRRLWWTVGIAGSAIVLLVALGWRLAILQTQTEVDDFWNPVLRGQRTVLICTGGVVFQQNNFSGVITAGKDTEYPFVSMQIASAIAQISGVLERFGATTELHSSPTTPLTVLREHTVVLLGGYNNQWAMRLLQSQRFQFTPEPVESIVDRNQPQVHWVRDHSLPYSSADDYALVARFRDSTTDGWVVVLAGLGRNGTEAAAQFVTSPRYMQQLRDRMGKDFANRNVEAILKVSVIDGKTGAPSILATQNW